MNQKPIILLDIDGVLNVLHADTDKLDWKFEPPIRSTGASGGFTLNLSREMGQALNELGCDIHWLTTWVFDWDHANPNVGAHFGWETKKCCSAFSRNGFLHWKADKVQEILAEPGPKVVWVDDDINHFLSMFEDGSDLDPHSRLLVICPDPTIGITKAHIQEIKEFLSD